MPLLKFDVIKGRTEAEISALLDAAHEAMLEAFDVPESDRYQSLTQHNPGELILRDTGLGYTRSDRAVLLTVISRPRTKAQIKMSACGLCFSFCRRIAVVRARTCIIWSETDISI